MFSSESCDIQNVCVYTTQKVGQSLIFCARKIVQFDLILCIYKNMQKRDTAYPSKYSCTVQTVMFYTLHFLALSPKMFVCLPIVQPTVNGV